MIVAVITAGGRGTRLSSDFKKQFALINGKPLLFWTIDKFVNSPRIDKIVVTLPEDELKKYKPFIRSTYSGQDFKIITGGSEATRFYFKSFKSLPI